MPTLSLAADAVGRPLSLLIVVAAVTATLVVVCLQVTGLLDLDASLLDDVGSWRWLPDA
ncbi:MAG: hypothetical protein ACRDF7_01390 [Candidatus Limnocylindrales bacterium]